MEQIDYNQCLELEKLEELIEEITDRLNEWIDKEASLEIMLIQELSSFPNIKDTLSPKNKFIKLRGLTEAEDVKQWVLEWIDAESKIKTHRLRLDQVKGKRDSKKKIFNVLPR